MSMRKILLLFLLPLLSFGQKTGYHSYTLDLINVEDDRIKVTVDATKMNFGDYVAGVEFNFPATIPGTYATLDYGRFIKDFKAFGAEGKSLKVKKKGNTYVIKGEPKKIEYWVDDSFDAKVRKNKIFEPAGTNNQEGRNFLINAAGYFGFFTGAEEMPITLEVKKSPTLYGLSAMNGYSYGNTQNFHAKDYHQLLDCPIMFAKPDTTSFKLGPTKVTIGVFSESGRELSEDIYEQVRLSMGAIESFLHGELPVDRYAFIFYIKDYSEFQGLVEGTEIKLGTIVKALRELIGQGFGALEHGNSSVYYLPDFGNNMVLDQMADVCIHEFFHILTPLGLHSEEIGNFNYIDPQMSKHLWLYEGITEYFAGISQVKGGVITREEYIRSVLRQKIVTADRYPTEKMPFTEMSENVLHKPYKKQYMQVYQRGALMGALLDIRIMELTQGEKDLLDVILELRDIYGPDKSFKDDDFIEEFVALVHPDLQQFFDDYVSGTSPLPVQEYLAKVGVLYDRSYVGPLVADPLRDYGIKYRRIRGTNTLVVKKIGKENPLKLVEGDIIELYNDELQNEYGGPEAGTIIDLKVTRGTKNLIIPYEVTYKEGNNGHFIRMSRESNAAQEQLLELWLTN
jgi:predicted metalloprotease with PDZ domain